MPLGLSYMGTKRLLAPHVARIAGTAPQGPFLDLFCGIGAVSAELGPARPIWCNDAQIFAATAAKALFRSQELPIDSFLAATEVDREYVTNERLLIERFQVPLRHESEVLHNKDVEAIRSLENDLRAPALSRQAPAANRQPHDLPYSLFSDTFSGSYLGLRQCLEVDSIRFASDSLLRQGRISTDQHRWWLLALCEAISKASTSTGHFAQYLKPNRNNVSRFLRNRSRSIKTEWRTALAQLTPVGSRRWRRRNRVFQGDALELVSRLSRFSTKPAVIYADPPYTKDQYSRYYHLLETTILYDYPEARGAGRVRPDRFISSFSIKSRVIESLTSLVSGIHTIGATLILSYPEDGLIDNASSDIRDIFKEYYGSGVQTQAFINSHSTMGGSKGPSASQAVELIFTGRAK